MRAPDVDVDLSTGEVVPLESLYRERRLALVFLRHLGCIFCREHVAQLRRLKDLNIVFVTMAGPQQTDAFRQEMGSPHAFICDPQRRLHQHFAVPRGDLGKALHPQVFIRGIGAVLAHGMQKRPEADPLQMPGVAVIDTDGSVMWQHRAKHMADNPSADQLEQRLADA